MDIKGAIAEVLARNDLSEEAMSSVVGEVMDGNATPAQIGGFLIGLRMKGETPAEITGAARAMRARARAVPCPDPEKAVDTCGTGGDGSGSANISTMSAIVAAAGGAMVAKHGNRALSSKSGSADVLEALGIGLEVSEETLTKCWEEVGIAFLFAPAHHAAMRHAAGPRRELGQRTLFNLLGPLTNPAGAANQIVGVFSDKWCEPVATALGALGARSACVVHGAGGIDEIAVRGPTKVGLWQREKGAVELTEWTPKTFGLDDADPEGLAGGDAKRNADIARNVFGGETGAVRNAVVMEAGVALWLSGVAADCREGAERAAKAIDDGSATRTLSRWAELAS